MTSPMAFQGTIKFIKGWSIDASPTTSVDCGRLEGTALLGDNPLSQFFTLCIDFHLIDDITIIINLPHVQVGKVLNKNNDIKRTHHQYTYNYIII